jgi:hypothetical protein
VITETDKAWIAGVLDNRCSIFVSHGSNIPVMEIVVILRSNPVIAVELSNAVGVAPYMVNRKSADRRACAEHCPDDHVHIPARANPRFAVRNAKAAIVLSNIQPYLRVISEKAQVATQQYFSLLDDRPAKMHVGRSLSAIKDMRNIGWIIPKELDDNSKFMNAQDLRCKHIRNCRHRRAGQI